jgi:TetR/AcrR family transcriptional regulator, acrAB operon repressor
MRKTKEEAEITRKTLLDAALRVFSRQGYEATRLEDIAGEAGVTRGAVYHHFGSKAELYNTLVRERFSGFNATLEEIMTEGGTPLQMLRRLLIRSLQLLEEDAEFRLVQEIVAFKTGVAPELVEGIEAKKQGTRAYVDYLSQLIEQGMDSGEIRSGTNARDAAFGLIGMVNGVSLAWLMDQKLFSLRSRDSVSATKCIRWSKPLPIRRNSPAQCWWRAAVIFCCIRRMGWRTWNMMC